MVDRCKKRVALESGLFLAAFYNPETEAAIGTNGWIDQWWNTFPGSKKFNYFLFDPRVAVLKNLNQHTKLEVAELLF